MKLSIERQKLTGAFYTPPKIAKMAVKYIAEIFPTMEDFLFYDPAAGEGALLEALPLGVEKYGTTLEWEDYQILKEKGIISNQFDFLNGNLSNLLTLQQSDKPIIVFTNPPFCKLPASDTSFAKQKYASNDATALFFYRIFQELQPFALCSFNKVDLLQSPYHQRFRSEIPIIDSYVKGFITHSKEWGLKGSFPIIFNIFCPFADDFQSLKKDEIKAAVFQF